MSDETARFALPFILPGQAQKELFHNEALAQIDALLHAVVEDAPLAAAPAQPVEGQCWIVGAGAMDEWSGRDHQLAAWTAGGWRFIEPQPGMAAWNKAAGYWVHWSGTGWSEGELPVARIVIGGNQVLGGRQSEIVSPSGGTTIDPGSASGDQSNHSGINVTRSDWLIFFAESLKPEAAAVVWCSSAEGVVSR